MERHRIDSEDLIKSIHLATRERMKIGRNTVVRIIPESEIDFLINYHPIEKYLQKEHIPYYLDRRGTGSSGDYKIDLRQIELCEP